MELWRAPASRAPKVQIGRVRPVKLSGKRTEQIVWRISHAVALLHMSRVRSLIGFDSFHLFLSPHPLAGPIRSGEN